MLKRVLVVGIVLIAGLILLRHAGSVLVQNAPRHADVLLVLGGEDNDSRYWHAVSLLKEGYGKTIILDALATRMKYGQSDVELATNFVTRTAPEQAVVCKIMKNSTFAEARYVVPCLESLHAHSVLLVTSDYHTRRAFSIFRKSLPTYQWSVAAAPDLEHFGTNWWTNREWAKTAFQEWERLIWWHVVDRWRRLP